MASFRVTCPECGRRPTVNDRGACACGVYLICRIGMPSPRPPGRIYKLDGDAATGRFRLAYDPVRGGV